MVWRAAEGPPRGYSGETRQIGAFRSAIGAEPLWKCVVRKPYQDLRTGALRLALSGDSALPEALPLSHPAQRPHGRRPSAATAASGAATALVKESTTISQFFDKQMPSRNPADILIRVNRPLVAKDYVLQDGSRVTMTPTKIEGAHVVIEWDLMQGALVTRRTARATLPSNERPP